MECVVLAYATVCGCKLRSKKFFAGAPEPFPLLFYAGKAHYFFAGKNDIQRNAYACYEPGEPVVIFHIVRHAAGAGGPICCDKCCGQYQLVGSIYLFVGNSGQSATELCPDGYTGLPAGDTCADDAEQPGYESNISGISAGLVDAGINTTNAGPAGNDTGGDTISFSVAGINHFSLSGFF